MNGYESNTNAISTQTNHNIQCNHYIIDNEILVNDCQPLLEFVNQTNIYEKLDQILNFDIKNVMSALKILIQDMNNTNVQHNCLLITKSILSSQSLSKEQRKQRALLFISDESLIKNLLYLEEYLIENDIKHESIIETYYQVLAKLSAHKKFVQNIYTNYKSSITKSLYVLERWKSKYKIVSAILTYLKHLLKSPICAPILCSENIDSNIGLINIINDILCIHKCHSFASNHAVEALAMACRCKEGISSILKMVSCCISSLVKHFEECVLVFSNSKSDDKLLMKNMRFSYNILTVFMHLSYVSAGREHLIYMRVEQKLLALMKTIVNNNIYSKNVQHLDRVFVLSSLVIQRLLDPLPLPLSSHFNPFLFEIPLIEESRYRLDSIRSINGNECNIDENYDFYRSDKSDSDNDSIDENDNESIRSDSDDISVSYEQCFPEINDFKWDLKLKQNDISNNSKDVSIHCKERKKSIENIKSLFCSCFSGQQNHNNNSIEKSEEIDSINNNDSESNKLDLNSIKGLINSAKEEKRKQLFMESFDWRQVYTSIADKTISIQPIFSLSEPELSSNIANNKLEPLLANESNDLHEMTRIKLLEHVIQRFDQKIRDSFIIYDIESEVNNLYPNKLQFDSRFECGNLRKVIQNDLSSNEYTLLLNTDTNTSSHIQWFYFKVSNMEPNVEYLFNIINCEKQSSLFNEGQRPIMFSTKGSQICDKPFWERVGYSIAYYRNHYVKDDSIASLMNGKTYYTLTFKIKLIYENDICYFAYNFPFSYTYLKTNIHFWQNYHNSCDVYFRHQTLCTSLAGNDVPVLTITSSKLTQSNRQYVILLGRVHPGESNSSWILKGCIDYLLSDRISAQKLLERYVFKIIPMTNPDGVINGNSRTGGQGDDLNRQWIRPNPLLHPIIFHSKSLIKYLSNISNNSNPLVLVDFHGHSRRSNIFLYGCSPQMSWKKSDRNKDDNQNHLALPLILDSIAPAFSLENCCFKVEERRERTARITFWRELGLQLSYTMECSQGGCDQGLYKDMHLGINQLLEMGSKFCSALLKLEFTTSNSNNSRLIPVLPKDLLIESIDTESDKTYEELSEDNISFISAFD